ncbi:MAG: putative metallo-hydrolase YycJ [Gemmatimonadaceae bacterium]|nr:putative metallo-hydrolase YycJ [Gemmatimonadaceae bacterium]
MKVDVLGSGSRGNAIVVDGQDGQGCLLVDCGFAPRVLASRMKLAGVVPEEVCGVILTHEHHDHISGLERACRRWHWPVAATSGTVVESGGAVHASHRLTRAKPLHLAGLTIEAMRTPHDAAESVGFILTHDRSGCRLAIVYDLGHWTANMACRLQGLDAIVVESNHDEEMLRFGPYPEFLKARVAGPKGHLSNADASELARTISHRGLRTIVLAHLSETNNTPGLVLGAMRRALRGSAFKGQIGVARQDSPIQFTIGPSGRAHQLALGL